MPEIRRARAAFVPQSGSILQASTCHPYAFAMGRGPEMKDAAIRIVTNEKLTRATHWAVFGLGALSLAFAVAATAASAF
jgi:hypothetical protein